MSAGHAHAKAPAYRRRTPEEEPLYQVLAEHLESFLERTRSSDRQLPAYVEEELRAYLDCGILAHGFLRVRCEDCDQDRVVAFSCQRRSFYPSCMGRRMVDTAARLTDEILPAVPVRQWVLSMPFEIRYRLVWDGKLVSAVLAVFLRVVYGWYRRQANKQGHAGGRCGSVTFVQRFGSALNCNPHFHVLMPDGVYVTSADGEPTFVRAPGLSDDDVRQIVETTANRVVRLLQRRGLLEEDSVDPLWEEEPLLATITVANRPQWLWIRLLEKLHAGATLRVYYNNERCSLEDSHGHAIPVDGHATQPTETIRRAVREILTLHFPDELSCFGT